MSFARKLKRQKAKKIYKEAVKKTPKKQRVPFNQVYKIFSNLNDQESEDTFEKKESAEVVGEEAELLTDLVVSDEEEEMEDASTEQDIIL